MQTLIERGRPPARRVGGGRRVGGLRRQNKTSAKTQQLETILQKNQAVELSTSFKEASLTTQEGKEFSLHLKGKPSYLRDANCFFLKTDQPALTPIEQPKEEEDSNDTSSEPSSNPSAARTIRKPERRLLTALRKQGLISSPKYANCTIKLDLIREIWYQRSADVYRVSGGFLVFGQLDLTARSEEQSKQDLQELAQSLNPTQKDDPDDPPELVEQTRLIKLPQGCDEENVKLLVDQTSCTREQAIQVLERNKGDLVNSIMDLTN